MAITPQQAAEKFAQGWLNSKPRAITQYASVASGLAQKAIDQQAKLLLNFTNSVNSGKWANGLRKFVGNDRMEVLYTEKLNSIDEITDAEKMKIELSVQVKQYLRSQLDAVLTLFKEAVAGTTTVPANLTDVALNQMLMSGIIAFEASLSAQSTPVQVYTACQAYMNTHYGWPIKA